MIVVDTNILAYLWVPGPLTEACTRLLARDSDWFAPPLWRSEFRNVLVGHLRAGNASIEAVIEAMDGAEQQMRANTIDVNSRAVLDLAASSGCSAYDCEFVALANHLGVPLVTADRRLARAFPSVAQRLEEA